MTAPAVGFRSDSARRADRCDEPRPRSDTPPAWSIVRRARTGWENGAAMWASGGSGGGGWGIRRPGLEQVANLHQQLHLVRRILGRLGRRPVQAVHHLDQEE